MKFIEISPGININKKEIICVERINEMTCKVSTQIGVYDSVYPSWRILMLLETPDIEEQVVSPQTPVDRTNLWGTQHFAG